MFDLFDLSRFVFSVAAANDAQRRMDMEDDDDIQHLDPGNSRIARQRAAKRNRQTANESSAEKLSQIAENE